MVRIAYGTSPHQVGDLHLPDAGSAPLVCLFHGGFWRMPYGREELTPVARDLAGVGFAVWNVEYRRVGPGGDPWPAAFVDVDALLAHLPALGREYPQVDLGRLFLVGHSAGGHLAFWAASRRRSGPPSAVIGLAPLLDLAAVHEAGLGDGAVEAFLGGTPSELPARYREASPRALLPLGVRQLVFHGDADEAVPLALSEAYVRAAVNSGDDASCVVLEGTDHMAFLDPASRAHAAVRQCLEAAAWRHWRVAFDSAPGTR
jgi:acetyl esterase/lipase